MYTCKINALTKISLTNTFLIHTQMCLVLNKSDINPYIYELKRFMNKLMFPKVSEIVLIQFRDLFVSLNDPVCHSQKTLISGEVSSCVGASPNKRKCPNPHSLSD